MLKNFFLLFVLLISCASYRGYADGLNFQTTITLSNGGSNGGISVGFEPASKNIICVWNDGTSILAVYSTDGGATFSTPIVIGEGSNANIGFDGAGKVFVTFNRGALGVFVTLSTDSGITYSTPIKIGSDANSSQIFFDSHSGHWIAIWTTQGFIMQSSYSADGGLTFSTPINLGANGGIYPGFAFDPVTHNGAIAWRNSATVYTAYTTDGGVTFSTPVVIATNATHDSVVKIAFDPVSAASNGVVIWVNTSNILQSAHTSDGGVTYGTAKNIFQVITAGVDPQLGFDSAVGNAIILSSSVVGIQETYSTDGGVTFSTPIVLSSIVDGNSALAFDIITGYAYASWYVSGSIFVTFSTDGGVTFATPVSFGITNPSEKPADIVSALNTVVVWPSTFGGGDTRIQAAVSFFVEPYSLSVFGKQQLIKGLFQNDIVNAISWNSIPTAQMYKVRDANNNLLFQGDAQIFYDHGKKQGQNYTYFVSWIDQFSQEVGPVSVTVP